MAIIINDSEVIEIKQDGIVLVGGCFDFIHPGHLEFLKLSKKLGKKLVVFLESDEKIRNLKGNERPLNNQIVRANNLAKIIYIDYIIVLKNPKSSEYYYNLVKLVSPDIIAVTAGDPFLNDKKKQANSVGGKVVEVMKRDRKYSTTKIIGSREDNKPSA